MDSPLCHQSRSFTPRRSAIARPTLTSTMLIKRERGHDVDRPALPERHELRADHLGPGREQVDPVEYSRSKIMNTSSHEPMSPGGSTAA
jgi:hypothetical protein